MYQIIFSKTAKKQLSKLEKNIQKRILEKLVRIQIRPEAFVEKLVGDPGYKLRIGDYRLIIDIHKNILEIHIIKVGHRKNIYDKL